MESYTCTYKTGYINRAISKVNEYNRYRDIFTNKDLALDYKSQPELVSITEKTSSKKWVSIILELLLVCIGLLLILFEYMQIFGIILLVFGTMGLFVSTFFHDKVVNWICNLCFQGCGISTDQIYEERKNLDLETDNKLPQALGCSQRKQDL